MKTASLKTSQRHATYSLGDLIMAVSSCSKNNREAVAAVADLLETGKVRLMPVAAAFAPAFTKTAAVGKGAPDHFGPPGKEEVFLWRQVELVLSLGR